MLWCFGLLTNLAGLDVIGDVPPQILPVVFSMEQVESLPWGDETKVSVGFV